jgi:hypothetical protein
MFGLGHKCTVPRKVLIMDRGLAANSRFWHSTDIKTGLENVRF